MQKQTRRAFLQQTMALASVSVLSRSVRGANERIGVAVIGCGGMGNAHINTLLALKEKGEPVDIVAVCDVWQKRRDAAAQRTGAQPVSDYRRVLDDKRVDAVCIATPDHWHAQIAVEGMEAGKDVYCEKPMTHWKTLSQPKRIVATVNRTRRVLQVGTQGMSDSIWEQVADLIKAGDIGALMQAQAADMRTGHWSVLCGCEKDIDPDAKPNVNLDWDMWLGWQFGLAPRRRWEPARFFAFRVFWDYSGGLATDWFPHILTPLVRAMGLRFPKRVVASGGLYHPDHKERWEVPDTFQMVVEYPDGPSIHLMACLGNNWGAPMLIRGSKATLVFEGQGAVIYPQREILGDAPRKEIARTRPGSLEEHWRDFLRCVRTREQPRSNAQLGYYVMTALHMGIRSFWEGRAMTFDERTETVRPA
ncbi:Inositol 2-dehydrogenase [bacterium HR17]|uniref:Inositol 2-dehydrogenase n=1 Tax=Candidatus Fervidibacter japonicus TaxID=2035412 RepID=A0A2H5XB16_9BACT|nr:Inositol 2-dehydrogenase [bacterium HR17]